MTLKTYFFGVPFDSDQLSSSEVKVFKLAFWEREGADIVESLVGEDDDEAADQDRGDQHFLSRIHLRGSRNRVACRFHISKNDAAQITVANKIGSGDKK